MCAVTVRPVEQADNPALAAIIRNALQEFGANKPGTVFFDPTTDHLYELFRTRGSAYFVAHDKGIIAGGAGIYPTEGLPPDTCELVKMYLHPSARGKGLGRLLIDKSLQHAREEGYKKVYLETMSELKQAVKIYEQFGFYSLDGPMGNSGHFGCGIWMLLEL